MITEADLRAALYEESLDVAPPRTVGAPLPLRVGPAPHRTPRRRRFVLAAGVVAAVAVLVVAGSALAVRHVLRTPGDGGPVPGSVGQPVASGRSTGFDPVYDVAVTAPSGLTVTDRIVTATRQTAVFEAPLPADPATPGLTGSRVEGVVITFAAGAYDPTVARRGTPQSVGGRPGFLAADLPVSIYGGGYGSTDDTQRGLALVWPYADDAWAVAFAVPTERRTAAFELSLARSVTPGEQPVPVPASLPTAPAGLVRQSLMVSDRPGTQGLTVAMLYKRPTTPADAPPDYTASVTLLSSAQAAVQATATASGPAPDPSSTDRVPIDTLTVDGVRYEVGRIHFDSTTVIDASARGSRLAVGVSWQDPLTPALDLRWLQFTPATALDDPSTWPDARTAFP